MCPRALNTAPLTDYQPQDCALMSTTPEDRVSFMMCEHGEVKSTFVMSGIDGIYPALRRFIFEHVSPRCSRPGGVS